VSIFGISALLRTKISHSRFFGLVRGIVGQDSSVEAGIGTSNTVRKKMITEERGYVPCTEERFVFLKLGRDTVLPVGNVVLALKSPQLEFWQQSA